MLVPLIFQAKIPQAEEKGLPCSYQIVEDVIGASRTDAHLHIEKNRGYKDRGDWHSRCIQRVLASVRRELSCAPGKMRASVVPLGKFPTFTLIITEWRQVTGSLA